MPGQPGALPIVVDTSNSPHARLKPAPLTAVTLTDEFWAPRRRVNREVTIPSQYRLLEETGRLDNLRRAAGQQTIPFKGRFFNDSDVHKWLEAASWALATNPKSQRSPSGQSQDPLQGTKSKTPTPI